jgi:hypothetical protein
MLSQHDTSSGYGGRRQPPDMEYDDMLNENWQTGGKK